MGLARCLVMLTLITVQLVLSFLVVSIVAYRTRESAIMADITWDRYEN